MHRILMILTLTPACFASPAAFTAEISLATQFLGPSPYLAFDHPDAGPAVSPFHEIGFHYFHLEDFEDGLLNTPGVSLNEVSTTNVTTVFSDSVDGDDGFIDGLATGNTRSLHSAFVTSSFAFEFSASDLGGLPTHAGVVWTDLGRNSGGVPLAQNLQDNTVFEAFGPSGESLGVIGPFSLGDSSISRTTKKTDSLGLSTPMAFQPSRYPCPPTHAAPHKLTGKSTTCSMAASSSPNQVGCGLLR